MPVAEGDFAKVDRRVLPGPPIGARARARAARGAIGAWGGRWGVVGGGVVRR
ncbi:hypothetical protein [Sphaerisporangium perillae]|uniref:hypothetical protein n=1 Tax=Sphaerisporangium perillae TaxID=2935860 RepID=UPI00200C22C5|nr:hypothetical protein [Sphaerisporangium perillae]